VVLNGPCCVVLPFGRASGIKILGDAAMAKKRASLKSGSVFARGSPRYASGLVATAYHEAGHAVADHHLRFKVRRISIRPSTGRAGYTQSSVKGLQPALENLSPWDFAGWSHLLKRLISLLAGQEAQRRYNPRSCRRHHPQADYAKAVDYAIAMCGGDRQEAELLIAWVAKRTRRLVRGLWWGKIEAMAKAVLKRGEMTGAEVAAVLGRHA